jgi:hypothetical protein
MAGERAAYTASTTHTTTAATAAGVGVATDMGEDPLSPAEARAFADSIHTAADVAEAEARCEAATELERFYTEGPRFKTVSLDDEGGPA